MKKIIKIKIKSLPPPPKGCGNIYKMFLKTERKKKKEREVYFYFSILDLSRGFLGF